MSQLTDSLQVSLDTLLASGSNIPAINVRNWGGQIIGAIAILEARARGNQIFYTSGVPGAALGLEGDLGVNKDTGDFYQYAGGQFVFLFNGLGRAGTFTPIAENAFGKHPAFTTQDELNKYLLGNRTTPPVVPAPTISGFAPSSGAVGDTVTITGTNFGAAPGTAGTVKFDGLLATGLVSWTNTAIQVKVPTGASTGRITVTTAGGSATSATDFTVGSISNAYTGGPVFVTTQGDSQTFGFGLPNPTTDSYPGQMQALWGSKSDPNTLFYVNNVGHSGYTSMQLRALQSAEMWQPLAAARPGTVGGGISTRLCGVNNFIHADTNNMTYTQALAQLKVDIEAATRADLANGFGAVVVVTVLNTIVSGPYGVFQSYLDDFNNWLRANYASWGNVFLYDAAREQPLLDASNTTYFQDGLHPTVLGAAILAAGLRGKVEQAALSMGVPVPTGGNGYVLNPAGVTRQSVIWIDTANAQANGATLSRPTGTTGKGTGHSGSAAGTSTNAVRVYAEQTVDTSNASNDAVFGLNTTADAGTSDDVDIPYAWHVKSGSGVRPWTGVADVNVPFVAVSNGDLLRVQVNQTVVRWYQNSTLVKELAISETRELQVDCSLSTAGSAIVNAQFGGANLRTISLVGDSGYVGSDAGLTRAPMSAKGLVTTTVSGANNNTFTATADGFASGGYSNVAAGATSNLLLAYSEFTIDTSIANNEYVCGWSNNASASSGYVDIPAAFHYKQGSGIRPFSGGNGLDSFTAVATGDVMRMQLRRSKIEYFKNGQLLYTQYINVVDNLQVDFSLDFTGAQVQNVFIACANPIAV